MVGFGRYVTDVTVALRFLYANAIATTSLTQLVKMESYPGYLGILKWSLEQNDGTSASEFRPMPEEVSFISARTR